jgi:hypothetical protein
MVSQASNFSEQEYEMNTTKIIAIVAVIGVISFVGVIGAAIASGSMSGPLSGSGNHGGGMMGGNGHMSSGMGSQCNVDHTSNGMMGVQGNSPMMNGTGQPCGIMMGFSNEMVHNTDGTWTCPGNQALSPV